MKHSRLVSFTAAAALSVGALGALVAPAAIAQAQPKETFMCETNNTFYEPGAKVPDTNGTMRMCGKDGYWKPIGPGHNNDV
jgi:hypothetical protein